MLEKILKMYVMYMRLDVRSPMPHLVGPPGCGKSTVVEQAAEMIGVNLHIINVSRLNPLDLEGVQIGTRALLGILSAAGVEAEAAWMPGFGHFYPMGATSLGSDMTKLTLKSRVLRFLDRRLGVQR